MNVKFKKQICIAAVITMLSSNTVMAAETIKMPADVKEKIMQEVKFVLDDTNYIVGNETKKADTAPYIKNGRAMMPIRYAAEAVGVNSDDVKWDEETKTVTIFKGDHIIQLTVGSDLIVVDGKKIKMDTAAEIKDGRMMLPVSFIARALGTEVEWNSVTRTITILSEKRNKSSKEKVEESVLTWDYTYEDLLNQALKNSRELKKAEMNVERTEIVKDELDDGIKGVPISIDTGSKALQINGGYQQIEGTKVALRIAKKQIEMTKDTIAYNVKSAYYDVLKNEDNKTVAKLAVDLANQSRKHAQLKYAQGLVSELEKKQVERNYEETKKIYDMAIKELEKAYEKLNDLVGFDAKQRYQLKEDIAFEEVSEENVDVHIQRAIAESPAIWALEQNIDLADLGVKLYVFNAGQEPYDAKEIDVKTAEIDLASAKQAYDQSLRNLYISLNQLKDQYETHKIALDKAVDDLKVAKVSMEIGNMLPIDVQRASLQLENTKKQLREVIMNYNQTAMAYEKLWIAAP
ncbi:stalk domain-containing protein [Clostridiaceae bacterium 35-E11]